MLAQEVFVKQCLLHRLYTRCKHFSVERHHGDLLEDDGVVHCVEGICAPAEWSVVLDEDGGDVVRVQMRLFKVFDSDDARVVLVRALDLLLRHVAGAGDLAVVVVGVGRHVCAHAAPRLCKECRPARMRVHDTTDVREFLIENAVRLRIRGGVEIALDALAFEIATTICACRAR